MSNYIINPYFQFGQPPPPATRNAWVELSRTTLGAPAPTIDVLSFAKKRYLMILVRITGASGATQGQLRVGTGGVIDSSASYASRRSDDGGADLTFINDSRILRESWNGGAGTNDPIWVVMYIDNNPNGEKTAISHGMQQNNPGAGSVPERNEEIGKWVNQLDQIDSIQFSSITGPLYNAGSEVIVMGFDPSDGLTALSNFWQPIAEVTQSVSLISLTTGAIVAPKYLWIQLFGIKSLSSLASINFNSDVGANYATRSSNNGGADVNGASVSEIALEATGTGQFFADLFVVNEVNRDKLVIEHSVSPTLLGAGTAPNRSERVAKWDNVVSLITEITLKLNTGTLNVGSTIKVWGSN